jgi:hypothetical protein
VKSRSEDQFFYFIQFENKLEKKVSHTPQHFLERAAKVGIRVLFKLYKWKKMRLQ